MKSKMKKAHGGKVKEDDDMKGEEKETKQSAAYKRGGKVAKKHGGKVDGKKSKARADKFSRGGMAQNVKSAAGMSPTSPLSGAGKTSETKKPSIDKEDD